MFDLHIAVLGWLEVNAIKIILHKDYRILLFK